MVAYIGNKMRENSLKWFGLV